MPTDPQPAYAIQIRLSPDEPWSSGCFYLSAALRDADLEKLRSITGLEARALDTTADKVPVQKSWQTEPKHTPDPQWYVYQANGESLCIREVGSNACVLTMHNNQALSQAKGIVKSHNALAGLNPEAVGDVVDSLTVILALYEDANPRAAALADQGHDCSISRARAALPKLTSQP